MQIIIKIIIFHYFCWFSFATALYVTLFYHFEDWCFDPTTVCKLVKNICWIAPTRETFSRHFPNSENRKI